MNVSKWSLILTTCILFIFAMPLFAAGEPEATQAEKSTLATIAAVDGTEILDAILAKNKTANPGVMAFARLMIVQHGANLAHLYGMVKNLNAVPLESDIAKNLHMQNKEGMIQMGSLHGRAFDLAYAKGMVAGHQAGLNLIDQKLMQTATTPEVKKFMVVTRAMVAYHLAQAKKLLKSLNA